MRKARTEALEPSREAPRDAVVFCIDPRGHAVLRVPGLRALRIDDIFRAHLIAESVSRRTGRPCWIVTEIEMKNRPRFGRKRPPSPAPEEDEEP